MAGKHWIAAVSACAFACGGSNGGGSGSGSADGDAESGSLSDADATATTPSTATADEAGDATAADVTGTTADDVADDGATGTIFDVHASIDLGVGNCEGGGGKGGGGGKTPEFSYIWVANAGQSTISKINTQTMVEEGRYITRPDSNGNPSRTSVNLSGDVAVANRN